ncbi:hypothetical protein BHE74_00015186 [Ensete ventricosum]|nr:hypothetical protein BHE74_00015186 [Ensete ventricosum]
MVKVDFSGHVSLAEKKSANMTGMAGRGGLAWGRHNKRVLLTVASSGFDRKSKGSSVSVALPKKGRRGCSDSRGMVGRVATDDTGYLQFHSGVVDG